MADHALVVGEQFEDAEHQRSTAELGMWIFLATEVMFFGGLMLMYVAYRLAYPTAFAHGSREMDLVIGGVNTAVLLVSSFAVAVAADAARTGARGRLLGGLAAAAVLGVVFLALKGVEWTQHWVDGLVPGLHFTATGPDAAALELFFWLYFALTGLHAIHLLVGVGLVSTVLALAWRGDVPPSRHHVVEIVGLYWHFVDVVWIFLLPMLYLIGRHAA